VKLTVLSVAFPFAPVGPHAVGGAEQVLNFLDRAIVAAGSTSLVVACDQSIPEGRLFPVKLPEAAELDDSSRMWARSPVQAAIDRAIAEYHVDLIHMHAMDFHAYRVPPEIPVLVTLHLPFEWYPEHIWRSLPRNMQICCVSESQRRTSPMELRDIPVVENGVELGEYDSNQSRESYALALGRICPEKNMHEALLAGSIAGTPVMLAGLVFPYRDHRQYFHEKVKLAFHDSRVKHKFLGPVDGARRDQLLRHAKCLLHPTLAPETSSLVAMEAMAVGTPVIAYRAGALNEIVEHGVTGFLVTGIKEMAEAIRNVGSISSDTCRRTAEQRFDSKKMIEKYFEIYDALTRSAQTGRRCYA
jgi:glycosyltransferase involved in cell wall biosynthesis